MNRIEIQNMPAGQEIDRLISENIFHIGWRKPTHGSCCTCQTCGWDYDSCQCGYSRYLEHAWKIVEKTKSFLLENRQIYAPDEWYCEISLGGYACGANADSETLAICRAALLAAMEL